MTAPSGSRRRTGHRGGDHGLPRRRRGARHESAVRSKFLTSAMNVASTSAATLGIGMPLKTIDSSGAGSVKGLPERPEVGGVGKAPSRTFRASYYAVATTLPRGLPARYAFIGGRGAQAKTIAELKGDFALDVVPTRHYTANCA